MDGKTPGQYGVRPTRISSQYSIGGHSVGGQSSHSQHSSSDIDHLIPPPSTDKEKSKMTRLVLFDWLLILNYYFSGNLIDDELTVNLLIIN